MDIDYSNLKNEVSKLVAIKESLKAVANENGGEITDETAFSEYPSIFNSLLNRTLTDADIPDIINSIPIATVDNVGVVKASLDENAVSVTPDGSMFVNDININRVTQTEEDDLILQGGNSKNIT